MTEECSVVHVVRSDAFAGVERYICDVASGLRERGWQVSVVGGDVARMRAGLPDGTRHRPARTTTQVARALLAERCAVVHAHMTAADLAACVTKPLTRSVVVSTRHFASPRGRRKLVRKVIGPLLSGIDLRIAISDFVAGSSGDVERVVPNGVRDLPLSTSVERMRRVLVLQRLEAEKDTETAVRAWASCSLPRQGWTLAVVGGGSQSPRLRALAVELGVGDSVDLPGFSNDPDVLLQSAAALLAPAPAEPFGLAVTEAMAAGTPVLAARGGAHVETLGSDAWLFPPHDVRSCAALLDRLATDRDGARSYGQSLRERQVALFSLTRHLDALEDCYRQALRGRAAR